MCPAMHAPTLSGARGRLRVAARRAAWGAGMAWAAVVVAGCSFGGSHVMAPFPASTLRAASPVGRSWVFRTEVPGAAPQSQAVRVAAADAAGATLELRTVTAAGPQDPPTVRRATWAELEGHAHYPEGATVVDTEVVAVPAGRFRCARYTVTGEDGMRMRAWFAVNLPGAPVLQIVDRAGVEQSRTVLVAFTAP